MFFFLFSCIHDCITVSEARKAFSGWCPVSGVLYHSRIIRKGDADSELYHSMTAQRPGSRLPKTGLKTTYSFIYDEGYEYMVPQPQGSSFARDIAIGGGLTKGADDGLYEFGTTDDSTTDPVIVSYLQESASRYFDTHWGHDHPDGRMRKVWTGIMGYSADGFPFIGRLPDEKGLYIAASFQGGGMVLSFLAAKALAKIITEEDRKLEGLDTAFPRTFLVTKRRLGPTFGGRLDTKVPLDLDSKTQS